MYDLLTKYKDYSINLFNIEREQKKPRKDYSCYSDIKNQIWYMYDELFDTKENVYSNVEIKKYYNSDILFDYINNYYNSNDTKDEWYEKVKQLATKYGFAANVKDYKENPDDYNGHVGDVCEFIRVAITSLTMTPDLYELLRLLGEDRIKNRFNKFSEYMKNSK